MKKPGGMDKEILLKARDPENPNPLILHVRQGWISRAKHVLPY